MVGRREFLKSMAVVAGGLVLARTLPVTVARAAEAKEVGIKWPLHEVVEKTGGKFAWPYTKLDPEYVRGLGYIGYYAYHCCAGAYWAILAALREKLYEEGKRTPEENPYMLLPLPSVEAVKAYVKYKKLGGPKPPKEVLEEVEGGEIMMWGVAGAVGWCSMCGALIGASTAVNLILLPGKKEANLKAVLRPLYRWYETAEIPEKPKDAYKRVLGALVVDKELPKSVSHSVLCHVSVGRWCYHSGYASGSAERSERCARLTGDVAAKTVELLNAFYEGKELKYELSSFTASCRKCHYKGKEYEKGQFTRGSMECEECHRDLRPHVTTPKVQWVGYTLGLAAAGIVIHFVVRSVKRKK